MKKINLVLMSAAVLMFLVQTQAKADEKMDRLLMKNANFMESLEAGNLETRLAEIESMDILETMESRLTEIKAMDHSTLSAAEKKALRKEVRSIKKDMDALAKSDAQSPAEGEAIKGSGIYISSGALIVILLLIILL